MKTIDDLIQQVTGISYIVHNTLGCGFWRRFMKKHWPLN